MNPWQNVQQFKYLLQQRRWEGNVAYEKVFQAGSVVISPIATPTLVGTKATPFVLLNLGGATHDPAAQQHPDLMRQDIEVTLIVCQPGENAGELAIVGGNRAATVTSSRGRGLAEVEEELFAVLQNLTAANGVQMEGWAATAIAAQIDEALGFVATRQYTFSVFCTTNRVYLAPTGLTAIGATGGTIALTWTAAPTRWDSYSQVIRYASGATPPATVSAGSAGPAVAVGATSASITGLTSGTYSVSVFAGYDEAGAGSAGRYSDPISVASVTVP